MAPQRVHIASRRIIVNCLILLFTVHRIHSTDDEGYICTHLNPLAVDSIEMAQGYRFDREVQDIYTSRDLLEFVPRRQWPEIQLPAPQVVAQPDVPMPGNFPDLLQGLQASHDSAVNLLRTQGVDACQVYKNQDAATILSRIRPQDKECRYCKRICMTSQNLKAHIRSRHLRGAALKCPSCNKSFGAPFALKLHQKTHEEGGRKYLCAVCGKGFVNKSQVNEHSKRHLQRRVFCAHCAKSMADARTLRSHLEICPKKPQPTQQ